MTRAPRVKAVEAWAHVLSNKIADVYVHGRKHAIREKEKRGCGCKIIRVRISPVRKRRGK